MLGLQAGGGAAHVPVPLPLPQYVRCLPLPLPQLFLKFIVWLSCLCSLLLAATSQAGPAA